MKRALYSMLLLLLSACGSGAARPAPPMLVAATTPNVRSVAPSRVAVARVLGEGCAPADLELVLPFYEGLRFAPAASSLTRAKSAYLQLAYPGALSMPLLAWRCAGGAWTALTTTTPTTTPVEIALHAERDSVEARLECFGPCAFEEIAAHGTWRDMAETVARAWGARAPNPPLASRVDAYHFFVRNWVSQDADPALRTDWSAAALNTRMRKEAPGTMAFVFGLDPNEVDLEGHYFWTPGARDEMRALVAANPAVVHHHWLNLRTYKYAVPRLGVNRAPPPAVHASAKLYAKGENAITQYVFEALEMCLGAPDWQRSRIDELRALLDVGFRVIALDEFPTAPTWTAEPCRATNHLHRPNDFADEQRAALDLVRRIAEIAHARGALLSSEEPSLALLPYTSAYMDGAFDEPADMYDHWHVDGIEIIPLFSAMFGASLTPYTRPANGHHTPRGWMVQEKISGN